LRGEPQGIRVIQDYAHHPTAVRETLSAIRAQFPNRRIWGLFEAESNTSRRKTFQDAYVHAFGDADHVIFVRPLEKDDNLPSEERLSADQLVNDLGAHGIVARFIPDPEQLLSTLVAEVKPQDVVLFMSGRDFLGLPARLVEILSE
jgi:UDP-N-acetylmuramate: L-alanyl-gamma-D-glutamyl-meso-diaminopimelate ligase